MEMNDPADAPAVDGRLRPHIVITGLMGVGKSTTASAVAALTGRCVSDSDEDIETLFGATGGELADSLGVEELHRLEAAVLLGALARDEPVVIGAAGWTIEDPRCREALARRAFVVVLHVPLEELARRIDTGDHRRSMDTRDLIEVSERRAPLFRGSADLILEATGSPEELARRIVDAAESTADGRRQPTRRDR